MFSKCLHNITVASNGIRIHARLPFISDENCCTVYIDLRVCVRIDINGSSRTMVASKSVASPVVSADTLDRELLRSIIDLCKDLLYIIRDGA